MATDDENLKAIKEAKEAAEKAAKAVETAVAEASKAEDAAEAEKKAENALQTAQSEAIKINSAADEIKKNNPDVNSQKHKDALKAEADVKKVIDSAIATLSPIKERQERIEKAKGTKLEKITEGIEEINRKIQHTRKEVLPGISQKSKEINVDEAVRIFEARVVKFKELQTIADGITKDIADLQTAIKETKKLPDDDLGKTAMLTKYTNDMKGLQDAQNQIAYMNKQLDAERDMLQACNTRRNYFKKFGTNFKNWASDTSHDDMKKLHGNAAVITEREGIYVVDKDGNRKSPTEKQTHVQTIPPGVLKISFTDDDGHFVGGSYQVNFFGSSYKQVAKEMANDIANMRPGKGAQFTAYSDNQKQAVEDAQLRGLIQKAAGNPEYNRDITITGPSMRDLEKRTEKFFEILKEAGFEKDDPRLLAAVKESAKASNPDPGFNPEADFKAAVDAGKSKHFSITNKVSSKSELEYYMEGKGMTDPSQLLEQLGKQRLAEDAKPAGDKKPVSEVLEALAESEGKTRNYEFKNAKTAEQTVSMNAGGDGDSRVTTGAEDERKSKVSFKA